MAKKVKESIAAEADRIVSGARQDSYGHPLDNFTVAADLISAFLGSKLVVPLTAEDVGLILVLIKVSRQRNSPKRDNLVDIAGYAKTVDMVIEERERRGKGSGS